MDSPPQLVSKKPSNLVPTSTPGNNNLNKQKDITEIAKRLETKLKARIQSTQSPEIRRLCELALNNIVYTKTVDVIMGIGTIQNLKFIDRKEWIRCSKKIGKLQKTWLLPLMREKKRVAAVYSKRIRLLLEEQA